MFIEDIHPIDVELCSALNKKPLKDYSNNFLAQEHYRDLVLKALNLPEEEYSALSENALKWITLSVERWNEGKELPDFFEIIEGEKIDPEKMAPFHSRKKLRPIRRRMAKKRATPRLATSWRIKELFLLYGLDCHPESMVDHLRAEGYSGSLSAVTQDRYHFIQCIRVLRDKGLLPKDVVIKGYNDEG